MFVANVYIYKAAIIKLTLLRSKGSHYKERTLDETSSTSVKLSVFDSLSAFAFSIFSFFFTVLGSILEIDIFYCAFDFFGFG